MRRGTSGVAVLLASALALALPGAAQACSVCSPGDDLTREAFLATTILLSVLPLLLVGGFAWWLHRRTRELEAAARQRAQQIAPRRNPSRL